MKRFTYILITLLLMPLTALTTQAQQKQLLKVMTRVIEKEYRFSNEFLLEINAEKATIDVIVTDGSVVKLRLEQSAMNSDVRIAERELGFTYFVDKKDRNRLYLYNYVQLSASSSNLSSIINNKYTIEVPRHCHLKIKNELGDVVVTGVSTTMRYELNYCGLKLNNAKGKLYVDSRIGDVTLTDCNVDAEFLTENVNLKMLRVGGSFDVQSLFGSISCMMSEQVTLINASLEQCEATLINRTNIAFSYAVEVNKGHISALDESLMEKVIVSSNKEVLRRKDASDMGTIIIESEYDDINLY